MVVLLHFEEKVHRKQLHRADTIPMLFLRLLCHILEHISYPTKPHLEHYHHCREHFTLEKWTQLVGYSALVATPPRSASPMPPQAEQQDELPSESIPPAPTTPPMLEATSTDPLTIPPVPPTVPSTSEASITISATEFHAMVHLFQTLTITHNALFRQMIDIRPSEPIALAEETIRVDVPSQTTHEAATEPSSPPESPTT
ncbi:hypothetical protein CK203_114302 [Vitis vinifera]|uniref:Uncharacterized protein n=1 Tax=Vitis vinifera TaxID=29760 RepID=A0A438C4K5_VITVI|nr:hypothetical protein CK203_114302 [Vitis vinifera]